MDSVPRVSEKEWLIVDLLASRREMYGLELVDASDGALKRGTVYVTLNRLEEKGLIRSRLENKPAGSGPPRRLYTLSAFGLRAHGALRSLIVAPA